MSSRVEYWRGVLAEQRRSGLSLRAFAAQRGVSVNTLQYWKYKRPTTAPQFEEIRLTPEASHAQRAPALEIVLRGDRVVRVGVDFDADLLRRVIAALEVGC